jgi:hypothetical protein
VFDVVRQVEPSEYARRAVRFRSDVANCAIGSRTSTRLPVRRVERGACYV